MTTTSERYLAVFLRRLHRFARVVIELIQKPDSNGNILVSTAPEIVEFEARLLTPDQIKFTALIRTSSAPVAEAVKQIAAIQQEVLYCEFGYFH